MKNLIKIKEGYMYKKIKILGLTTLVLASISPAIAFDLEDYATTFRATRDAWLRSELEFAGFESRYKKAFKDRIEMEMAVRLAQKQEAQTNEDTSTVAQMDEEIAKLNALKASAAACGIK